MEKLINKFEEIIDKIDFAYDGDYRVDVWGKEEVIQLAAEEAKKLAIEFAKYMTTCKDLEGNIIGNNNHFIDNFGSLLFDKFIDEYYE